MVKLVNGLPEHLLDAKPKPEGNSIREILVHITKAEVWYVSRLELDPEGLQLPEFPQATLGRLEAARAWALARLRTLPRDERNRTLTHSGEVWTLKKVLRRFLYHETYHRRQIERRLEVA